MKLQETFRTLGIPLGLVAVIVALLNWAGLSLEQIEVVAAALIGFQVLGSLLVDVLKYAGVIKAGESGNWSAGYNLLVLIIAGVWLYDQSLFDLPAIDARLHEIVTLSFGILAYIVQIVGTKSLHEFVVKVLGIRAFTFQPHA